MMVERRLSLQTRRELLAQVLPQYREASADQKRLQLDEFTQITGYHRKYAVRAGLTLPWSNGPLEGHVNRLKLIKRSMYGRAEFDLLKRRVLHRSKRNQERKDKYKHHQGQQANRLLKNSTDSQHTIIGISRVA